MHKEVDMLWSEFRRYFYVLYLLGTCFFIVALNSLY